MRTKPGWLDRSARAPTIPGGIPRPAPPAVPRNGLLAAGAAAPPRLEVRGLRSRRPPEVEPNWRTSYRLAGGALVGLVVLPRPGCPEGGGCACVCLRCAPESFRLGLGWSPPAEGVRPLD